MNKTVSIVLLVIGIMLAGFGIAEADSFSSSVSEFFTGTPTDKAIWMMIAGVALAIVGLVGVTRGGKA